jgi:hypothetical protein
MATKADLESFLVRSEVDFEEVEYGTWVLRNVEGHGANVVVRIQEPIVVFRARVMDVPESGVESFLRRVLEINATEMLHASYGLEGNTIIAGGALTLEHLDENEFQAMLDDVTLAISRHRATLAAKTGGN